MSPKINPNAIKGNRHGFASCFDELDKLKCKLFGHSMHLVKRVDGQYYDNNGVQNKIVTIECTDNCCTEEFKMHMTLPETDLLRIMNKYGE